MRFAGYPKKKNQLIGRLKTLTGEKLIYNGAPAFSYDIGGYRVFSDGSVAVLEADLDKTIIRTLMTEGLLIDAGQMAAAESEKDYKQVTFITPSIADDNKNNKTRGIVIREKAMHTQTMVNLINMIYAKEPILNHALGRIKTFWVAERVVTDLSYERPETYQDLKQILKMTGHESLVKGIIFEPDAVIFNGFPKINDKVMQQTYEKLAAGMVAYADNKKWISSRRVITTNEKYFFRNWLNRIGFDGPENKTFRKLLLKNLEGNSAYRTKEQLMAYRLRQQAAYHERRRSGS